MEKFVKVSQLKIGNKQPLTIIAGPCQIESRDHAFEIMQHLQLDWRSVNKI